MSRPEHWTITRESDSEIVAGYVPGKGVTVILITHNSAIAPMADRVIHIKNGKVSKILKNDHPVPVETIEW